VVKILLNIGIAFVLFILGIVGYQYIDSKSLKAYCKQGVVGQSYEQVNKFVREEELYLHRVLEESTSKAIINNHASPFFRMACVIELESGVVQTSQYRGGD
jgi:hypothetical protein